MKKNRSPAVSLHSAAASSLYWLNKPGCFFSKWHIKFVVPNILGVDPPQLTFDLQALQRTCFKS